MDNSSGFDVQIQEMKRLMKSTTDPEKLASMQLMIDQLLQKQQKFLQNMADGIDGDEIDPFQDFTKSPVNDNNRPMSSRPMSARRKSVPNLNIIHEGKGTKMTVNNPNNTPNQKLMLLNNMAAMTSPGVHKARQRRRSR